jgi:hypothetical protein
MNFISYLQLPFQFEVTRLQKDVALVLADPWPHHGNRWIYRGEWSGLALRNVSGKPTDLDADPVQVSTFINTPLLDRCPNIQEVLASFACPLAACRREKFTRIFFGFCSFFDAKTHNFAPKMTFVSVLTNNFRCELGSPTGF